MQRQIQPEVKKPHKLLPAFAFQKANKTTGTETSEIKWEDLVFERLDQFVVKVLFEAFKPRPKKILMLSLILLVLQMAKRLQQIAKKEGLEIEDVSFSYWTNHNLSFSFFSLIAVFSAFL